MAHDSTTQLQLWIERMKAGDASARGELINHACDRLRRLTRKLLADFSRVRPWEDTDDVLNSAVVRLLNAMRSVQVATVAEFFRLATRQIRWELLDLARKYRDRVKPGAARPPSDSDVEEDPGSTTMDPARLAAWNEFHERVEQLPDEERDVFELVWYQGLSHPEAGVVLGISEATVGRRWLAARLKLAAYLRPGGSEIDP